MVERSESVMFLIYTLLISFNCTLLAHENVTTDFHFLVNLVVAFFLLVCFSFT